MLTFFMFLIFFNFHAAKSFLLGEYPISCDDPSIVEDGVYNIYPDGVTQTQVFCEFTKGRWLTMMNKIDRTPNVFKRTFNDYKFGFGTPTSNFWFGLENIRKMLAKGALELRFEMNNGLHWMEYTKFDIGSQAEGYALNLVYNNTGNLFDTFSGMNGYQFYAYDTSSCGVWYGGGWWFTQCFSRGACLTCEPTSFPTNSGHYWNGTNWIFSSNTKMFIRPKNRIFAKNCYEIYKAGRRVNGIYVIYLDAKNEIPTKVYCEMDTGGWTRILSRDSTSFSFVKNILEYEAGFSDTTLRNSWFGLNNIHTITNKDIYQLRIELTNSVNSTFFIVYDIFYLGPQSDGYRLYVGKKVFGTLEDALAVSNRQRFMNVDFYENLSDGMCTLVNKGGWWYNSAYYCYQGCLTCILTNPVWSSYNAINANAQADLTFSQIKMMIRPLSALKDEEESNAENLISK